MFTSCSSYATGGALFIDVNTSAVVAGSSFANNTASDKGGGFFASSSAVVMGTNLLFTANHASSGGAFAAVTYSTATLSGCIFTANSATAAGGALFSSGATALTVQNGTFSSNLAAGFAPHGGAASLENVATVTLAACTFANNAVNAVVLAPVVGLAQQLMFAGSQGAGALFIGNSPLIDGGQPTTASISTTTFQNNSAPGSGGALLALAQNNITLMLTSCVFSANTAGSAGGALTLSGAVVATISGCNYTSNAAGTDGGALALLDGCVTTSSGNIYSSNAAIAGHGGAILLQGTVGASTALSGDALSSNAALYGGALAVSGAAHTLTVAASPASVLSGNTATYGGVFSLSAAAQPISGQILLAGASFSNNAAGTGAVFFSDVNVGQPACSGCSYSNNRAANYGAVSAANPNGFATLPVAFSVAAPAALPLGSACGITIVMADAYNNTVMFWPGFAASALPAASLSGSLLAGAYTGGSATVANAVVNALPSTNVTITVAVTSPPLGSSGVSVSMLQCGVNQVFQASTVTCECIRGAFQPVGSTAPCTLCPAGTFAAGIGEVACSACAATAVSGNGSSACLTCPEASHPLTDDLCVCETNYYGTFADTNNGTCTACPANAVCQGGVIVADQGYWKSSSTSIDIQQCLEPEACMFQNRTQILLSLTSNGSAEDTIRAAQCWNAYSGPLCSICAPGFGRDTDLKCGLCPPFHENTAKLAASSFTNLMSVLLTIHTNMAGGVSPPLHSQIIKIMLNYLTVTSLASRVPLRWPKRIEEMLVVQATASHSGGKTVAIECSLTQRSHPKFYDLVSGYLILVPIAGLLVPLVCWVVWYIGPVRATVGMQQRWVSYAQRWARHNKGPEFKLPLADPVKSDADVDRDSAPRLKKEDVAYETFLTNLATVPLFREEDYVTARKRCKSYFIISVVVVLFYLWTPVTSAILHLFVCVEIDPHTHQSPYHGFFLQQDTSETCWRNRHRSFLLGGALVGAVLVVLGIPISSGVYLWANRHRLTDPLLNLRFGFVYYGYKKDACYYESIIMLRKLALVIVTVFFNHGAQYAGAYVLCIMQGVLFCAFSVHARVEPYEEPILDRLERYSMSASIFTLWIGLFFYLGIPPAAEVVLTIVLAGINAAMCIAFIACIFSEFIHAAVIGSMPPGSTRANVKVKAMVDHCIYHNWPKVVRTKVQWRRRLHAWILIKFIRWLDHSISLTAKELEDEYIPTVLHEMQAFADAVERKRRNELIAKWASVGLIRDEEIAAWVCWYEGANRDPATLTLLIKRSLKREKDLDTRVRRIKLPTAVLTSSQQPSRLARLLASAGLSIAPMRPPLTPPRESDAADVERAAGGARLLPGVIRARPARAEASPAVVCEAELVAENEEEASTVPEAGPQPALADPGEPPAQSAPAGAAEDVMTHDADSLASWVRCWDDRQELSGRLEQSSRGATPARRQLKGGET